MTAILSAILTHTPPWVWLILAGLVALGLKEATDHSVSAGRLLTQPLAVGALSLHSAFGTFGLHPWAVAGWLLGAAAGVWLNRWLGLPRRVSLQADGRFRIGGSWAPMALLMLIFWLRYAIVVALALAPALGGQPVFRVLGCAAYGLASGLVGARAWRVLQLRRVQASVMPQQMASA